MPFYAVTIAILAQPVWANTIEAEGPGAAREAALRAFLSPISEEEIAEMDERNAEVAREMNARQEPVRQEWRLGLGTVSVRRSRARGGD